MYPSVSKQTNCRNISNTQTNMKKQTTLRNKRRKNQKWLLDKLKNPDVTRMFYMNELDIPFFQSNSRLYTIYEVDYYRMRTLFTSKIFEEYFYLVKKEIDTEAYEQLEGVFENFFKKNLEN